jgi:hypothetical protein
MTEVDSHEFTEWMAYNRLEPFGPQRGDLRAAIVAATIANVYRDKKKKPTPFKASDFMPDFDGEYTADVEAMSPEETLEIVRAMHEQFTTLQKTGMLNG